MRVVTKPHNSGQPPKRALDLATFLRRATIVRALRAEKEFRQGHPGRYMLVVPDGEAPTSYVVAAHHVLGDVLPELEGAFDYDVDAVFAAKAARWVPSLQGQLTQYERYIVLIDDVGAVPLKAKLMMDRILALQPPTLHHWRAAVKRCFKLPATDNELRQLSQFPLDLLTLAVGKRNSIAEIITEIEAGLAEERSLSSAPSTQNRDVGPRSMTLDQLPGYGVAKAWGLDLARDLADWKAGSLPWADVDRGVLLHGPPGTGKTTFAAALATTCKAHLVATSVAKWQAEGHLGDLLKAMRASFAEARKQAPSILFIDEMDSIGDRERFTGSNEHYCREACNGLLEAIDALDAREGVVIVGACNDATRLDAALLRSGRLDRQIAIPLPDDEARQAIVAVHQPDGLSDSDRAEIAAATEGLSGADLEALCRRARRRARKDRRPVVLADFQAELPEAVILSDEMVRMAAIHEAGHAVLAALFDRSIIEVKIARSYRTDGIATGSHLRLRTDNLIRRTRDYYLDEITMTLGGVAAESLLLGNHADGGGGVLGSDLQVATDLATLMEGSMGLGRSLVFHDASTPSALDRLRRGDRELRKRVHEVLEACLERATSLIAHHRTALETIARTLIDDSHMDGNAVRDAVRPPKPELKKPFVVSG